MLALHALPVFQRGFLTGLPPTADWITAEIFQQTRDRIQQHYNLGQRELRIPIPTNTTITAMNIENIAADPHYRINTIQTYYGTPNNTTQFYWPPENTARADYTHQTINFFRDLPGETRG